MKGLARCPKRRSDRRPRPAQCRKRRSDWRQDRHGVQSVATTADGGSQMTEVLQ